MDLRSDSGSYTQSANCQYWNVFGADSSTDNAMGTNYKGSSTLNTMDNALNITAADDLVSDSPT